MKARALSVADR